MAVIAHSKLVLCVLGFVRLLLYCFCVLCNNVHLSHIKLCNLFAANLLYVFES